MKSEFTAIIEFAPDGGFHVVCPEVPGAEGHGVSIEEAEADLVASITTILALRDDDYAPEPEDFSDEFYD